VKREVHIEGLGDTLKGLKTWLGAAQLKAGDRCLAGDDSPRKFLLTEAAFLA